MFRYTPLKDAANDIRLLHLYSGNEGGVIECQLRVCSLSPLSPLNPEWRYQALSYTWGNAAATHPILMNGKTFLVSNTLASALKRLRFPKVSEDIVSENQDTVHQFRILWIDAICIDQQNVSEKNVQVQKMKQIYQLASSVVIWLGDDHESGDEKHHYDSSIWELDHLEKGCFNTTRSAVALVEKIAAACKSYDPNSLPEGYPEASVDPRQWANLSRLFRRPWFERLWIVQEVIVASRALVYCGGFVVDWTDLLIAARFILRPYPIMPLPSFRFFPIMGAERVTALAQQNFDRTNLLRILHQAQGAKAKDPRDRLFGLLGLCYEEKDAVVDYSKSVEEVYTDWASMRIKNTNTLDVLGACADSGSSGVPSWVPDLRRPWGQDKVLFGGMSQGKVRRSFDAGSFISRSPIATFLDNVTLNVTGTFLGRISELGIIGTMDSTLSNLMNLNDDLLTTIKSWEEMILSKFGLLPQKVNAFIRTLFRDFVDWEDEDEIQNFIALYELWRRQERFNKDFYLEQVPQSKRFEVDIERLLFPRIHGNQLFLTDRGDVGIVAGNCCVLPEDGTYVLAGCSAPVILRQIDREVEDEHERVNPHNSREYVWMMKEGRIMMAEFQYRMLGPCYIHGYMWSENVAKSLKRYGGEVHKVTNITLV
ncbi:hypothetical protein G7Y89_g1963 [Cudoniella acicularis]|uniref:Heterokaryon incompatibility domain-containing protein n=1 Tax=Cudoniella acicularis TaxID=354080 RepID=A0A8H4RVZ2_9HELO|nr:hypothetical protein G7Y89_g1963 [Cudoniella acicularis]